MENKRYRKPAAFLDLPKRRGSRVAVQCLLAAFLLLSASGLGAVFFRAAFPDTTIVLLYLLAVLMTACFTKGYVYGLLSSVASTFAFNYFFTFPYHTLRVDDPSYFITFLAMTIAAFITSTLTSGVKRNAEAARKKEEETKLLYNLTSSLTVAKNMEQIAADAVVGISHALACRAGCLCFDETGAPEATYLQMQEHGAPVSRRVADPETLRRRMEELRAEYAQNGDFYDWPICGKQAVLGLIRIPRARAALLQEPELRLLRSMIESVALAMDRLRSTQQQVKAQRQIEQERYRGNLLRAISHDLRTPLSGIMGTSEMMMDMSKKEDPRFALAKGIYEDATWLHALVENILSLTRLQEGRLILHKEVEAVEEIIGGAVRQLAARAPEYPVRVEMPEEVLMAPMDGKLILQVLINLLDNAVKHSNPGDEICIRVSGDRPQNRLEVAVADRGEGIAAADLPHIFQTFYTSQTKPADAKRGIGLGLTICDSIIKAHGGTIRAQNRTDGPGAEFVFTIPMKEAVEDSDV